jgi:hypothetical protein
MAAPAPDAASPREPIFPNASNFMLSQNGLAKANPLNMNNKGLIQARPAGPSGKAPSPP